MAKKNFIKNLFDWKKINEADVNGNKGVPKEFVNKTDQEAQQELQQRIQSHPPSMQRIGAMLRELTQLQAGHEAQLTELAKSTIMNEYGQMLQGVELDFEIVSNPFRAMQETLDQMPEAEDRSEENREEEEKSDAEKKHDSNRMSPDAPAEAKRKISTDPELKKEVDKRKIANSIAQGEAKNTHRMIHIPEVREALDAINPRLFTLYDDLLKTNEYQDWMIPANIQKDMWVNQPDGMAGQNAVRWIEDEDKEDHSKFKPGADNEGGDGDSGDSSEGSSDGEDHSNMKPIIIVKGKDFPMLLHEAVKGVYELINQRGIPEDGEMAANVMLNTDTIEDEIQDLRYGPYIAKALRSFINVNTKTNEYPELLQFTYGELIALPADDFLRIMKGILQSTITMPTNAVAYNSRIHSAEDENDVTKNINYIPYARKAVDDIIEESYDQLSQYDKDELFGDHDSDTDDSVLGKKPVEDKAVEDDKVDYSKMNQGQLQKIQDKALDEGDFETVRAVSKFIK
jgi:hypothetical protein